MLQIKSNFFNYLVYLSIARLNKYNRLYEEGYDIHLLKDAYDVCLALMSYNYLFTLQGVSIENLYAINTKAILSRNMDTNTPLIERVPISKSLKDETFNLFQKLRKETNELLDTLDESADEESERHERLTILVFQELVESVGSMLFTEHEDKLLNES